MSSRKSYRNKMVRKDALKVTFVSLDGAVAVGCLLDVHGAGAAVSFQEEQGGARPGRGDTGTLQFTSEGGGDFGLAVQVRSVCEVQGGLRVGFAFDGEKPSQIQWPTSLRSLFNRRGAYRVHPRPEEVLRVILKGDPEVVGERSMLRGKLMDISLTGARVRLAEPLSWVGLPLKVRVTLLLPEMQLRVMLGALLRNSYASAEHAGLEFARDKGRRFGIKQKEIREYIMQRQREELRRTSWLNTRED